MPMDPLFHEIEDAEFEICRRIVSSNSGAPGEPWILVCASDDHRYSSLEVARRWRDRVNLLLVPDFSWTTVAIKRWRGARARSEVNVWWEPYHSGDETRLAVVETATEVHIELQRWERTGQLIVGPDMESEGHTRVQLSAPVGDRSIVCERPAPGAVFRAGNVCRIDGPDLGERLETLELENDTVWRPYLNGIFWTRSTFVGKLRSRLSDAIPGAFQTALAEHLPQGLDLAADVEVHAGHFGQLSFSYLPADPVGFEQQFLDAGTHRDVVRRTVELVHARAGLT